MVRAVLIVGEKNDSNSRWRVRQMPYHYYENLLFGRISNDRIWESYWHINISGRGVWCDGNYVNYAGRDATINIWDVYKTNWFVEKFGNLYRVLKHIRKNGEIFGIKNVLITSSKRDRDGRRILAKELALKVFADKKFEMFDLLKSLALSRVLDMYLAQYWINGYDVYVLMRKDEALAYIIDGYLVGNEERVKMFIAESI